MFRKLLIVFASGLILSVMAFGAAWVAGGEKLRNEIAEGHGWSWTVGEDEDDTAPRKSRHFTVAAGTQLAMEIPVDLSFTRGEKAEMVVSGPASVIDRLVWENGHLSLPNGVKAGRSVRVNITAPEITGLALDAPGEVTLTGLRQERLTLKAQAPVDLEAEGKVRQVFASIEGPGNLDLGRLEAEDATVRLDGVGNMTIGATGTVDVEINGIGNVSLVRKPATLRSSVNGLGSIDHDY